MFTRSSETAGGADRQTKRRNFTVPGSLLIAVLALAGCGSQGDFGRDNSSILAVRMGVHPYTPVSEYSSAILGLVDLTPAETDLRRLADLLTTRHAHQKTHGNFAATVPILPRKLRAAWKPSVSAKSYARAINSASYRSGAARLNAITDDMRADSRNIDGFWVAIALVYQTDSIRTGEIDAGGVRGEVADDILRRIEQNRAIVDRVVVALGERLQGYRIAISEAFVADPGGGYAGARLEYDALRRQIEGFDSNLKGLGTRHALSLPRTDGCVAQSLGRMC